MSNSRPLDDATLRYEVVAIDEHGVETVLGYSKLLSGGRLAMSATAAHVVVRDTRPERPPSVGARPGPKGSAKAMYGKRGRYSKSQPALGQTIDVTA